MSARIVAQIDALLARLTAARELLASTVTETGVDAEPGRVVTMDAPSLLPEPPAEAIGTPVRVTVLKPHGPRERRTVTRRRGASTSAAPALTGPIPQNPVAVSPQQLAAARARTAAEANDPAPAPAVHSAFDELLREVAQRTA